MAEQALSGEFDPDIFSPTPMMHMPTRENRTLWLGDSFLAVDGRKRKAKSGQTQEGMGDWHFVEVHSINALVAAMGGRGLRIVTRRNSHVCRVAG